MSNRPLTLITENEHYRTITNIYRDETGVSFCGSIKPLSLDHAVQFGGNGEPGSLWTKTPNAKLDPADSMLLVKAVERAVEEADSLQYRMIELAQSPSALFEAIDRSSKFAGQATGTGYAAGLRVALALRPTDWRPSLLADLLVMLAESEIFGDIRTAEGVRNNRQFVQDVLMNLVLELQGIPEGFAESDNPAQFIAQQVHNFMPRKTA